ncbi:hypothetical protein M378DRAFT_178855 [Amanita muscaria Koide BX008]|uniref:Uncharacterized protein n=1 Tax=Amanita muscaria (strain Koide BX008) TaxID=946122 RepID=A0A0C2WRR0_AMAMK|nr:hypothetical protein M378DRAFT_178855 [Amanita muscaria Koide BX008]
MSQAAERRLSYDKNLLREADVVLQQQMQLRSHGGGFASSSQARPAHLPTSNVQVRSSEKATPSDRGIPFWRTTKGKVLIVVLIVVIIGAVVGAAVGTTVNKSQSVSSNSTGQGPGSITPADSSSVATAISSSSLLAPTATTVPNPPLATARLG